jgi:hypothetical protein
MCESRGRRSPRIGRRDGWMVNFLVDGWASARLDVGVGSRVWSSSRDGKKNGAGPQFSEWEPRSRQQCGALTDRWECQWCSRCFSRGKGLGGKSVGNPWAGRLTGCRGVRPGSIGGLSGLLCYLP